MAIEFSANVKCENCEERVVLGPQSNGMTRASVFATLQTMGWTIRYQAKKAICPKCSEPKAVEETTEPAEKEPTDAEPKE